MTGSRANSGASDKVEATRAAPAECWTAEPKLFDTSTPNIARVYDYWLGGKDNYEADRAEAERMIAVYPRLPFLARQSRLFLARAVHWLAEARRHPIPGSRLRVAHRTEHSMRSPRRYTRTAAWCTPTPTRSWWRTQGSSEAPGVTAIRGDIAEPDAILADVRAQRLVNLAEPTAVIFAMVLHFFDAATASDIVATFARALRQAATSCSRWDPEMKRTGDALTREYQAGPLYNHSFKQILAFAEGLELVPPGVTDAMTWMPGSPSQPPPPQSGGRILAGIARKPDAGTQVFSTRMTGCPASRTCRQSTPA